MEDEEDKTAWCGNTNEGDLVIFRGRGGLSGDLTKAREVFTEGKEYTVSYVEDGGWITYLWFDEVDGNWNSCMFEHLPS